MSAAVAVAQSQQRRDPLGGGEREFVDAKRRMGASWDAIAAMLNRPTLDVRRAFDPEFRASGFALAPVAAAAPKTSSVLVCSRRVPVEGLTSEELIVLKALAPGEVVSYAGMRARVSGIGGELVGVNTVRRLVKRIDQVLPEPLRIVGVGRDGWVVAARPGEAGREPIVRTGPAPDPFGLGLPPLAVAVLKRLLGGEAVSFADLQQTSVAITGKPMSFESLRARVSSINRVLPAGVRISSEHRFGYRLTGGGRLTRAPLALDPSDQPKSEERAA